MRIGLSATTLYKKVKGGSAVKQIKHTNNELNFCIWDFNLEVSVLPMFRSTLLLLMFVFGFGGCFRAEGPVELRGKSHLENYLCGREVWELHDAEYYTAEAFAQYWKFLKDGTFSVWVPNEFSSSLEIVFPDVFPKGTYRAEGQWKVVDGEDDFSVQLTDIIRPSSEALIPDAQLVIGWVDGKLRLLIGGAHYMRNMVVAEKQEEGIL